MTTSVKITAHNNPCRVTVIAYRHWVGVHSVPRILIMPTQKRNVSVVGTSFHHGATEFITRQRPGTTFAVKRQPTNEFDKNAIAIQWGNRVLGYLPRGLAAQLAPLVDGGLVLTAIKAPVSGCVVTISFDAPDLAEQSEPEPAPRVFRGGPEIPTMNVKRITR